LGIFGGHSPAARPLEESPGFRLKKRGARRKVRAWKVQQKTNRRESGKGEKAG